MAFPGNTKPIRKEVRKTLQGDIPMPNIQQIMNEEIRRLARKEVKAGLDELKVQLATLRKTIVEQNRRIKTLEKQLPAPVQPAEPVSVEPGPEKSFRITPERIKKLREKLSLSQAQFAALLGVNLHSVNHWENGKTSPRESQKRRIAEVRDMGKRELRKALAEKNITLKPEKSVSQPRRKATVAEEAGNSGEK